MFQKNLWLALRKTEQLSRYRILQNGCTLLLLLIYYCDVSDFTSDLHEKIVYWKQRIQEEVGDGKMFDMLVQCKAGKNILQSPEEEDSGIFSEEQTQTSNASL